MNTTPNQGLGLPWWAIIGLALLAVPRVVLHDLHLIDEGTWLNALFVWVPPIVWITVVVAKRIPRPFVALLSVGVVYGLLLAGGHLLFWDQAFPAGNPQLGGNLADIDPVAQSLIFKTFATFSSGVTGTLVGVICGLIATGLSKLIYRSPHTGGSST
ncbi:hypothetical protein GCM10009720_25450 [Yaniella flava]|uniref:Uncharacterized protein n=1 Tax=Yaniella flava TaxID=287930 RepID=A0ABN2UUS9_9MICC|nr:hypothetical protein [Micrococcaceae bacterium]